MNYTKLNKSQLIDYINDLKEQLEESKDAQALENERQRADEAVDALETLKEEHRDELREVEETHEETVEPLEGMKYLVEELKLARERLHLGVTSEADRIVELTDKILESI